MAIISFFSYKGGSGRTTTTLNTLYYLIQEVRPKSSSPLVIIDADTESYGMSMLIKERGVKYEAISSLQGLALRATSDVFTPNGPPRDINSYPNLKQFFIPVGNWFTNDVANDAVLLLRSDVTPTEQYDVFGNAFTMNGQNKGVSENLSQMVEILKRCGCTVVFDTPSGTQDMAMFSLDRSKVIVCCMRPSVQFEAGTRLCFEKLMGDWYESGLEKSIVFCPSAVPYRQMNIDGKDYPEHYKKTLFKDFKIEMDSKSNDVENLIEPVWDMEEGSVLGIPEVDRFKWQECCLAKLDSNSEDERLAMEKYKKLAQIVLRRC